MSKARDRWGKFESAAEKRKKAKRKEHFKASARGSFDKLITKSSQRPSIPAASNHHSRRTGSHTSLRRIPIEDRLLDFFDDPWFTQQAIAWFIVYCNAQMAVGAVYLNDCPRQPFIPVYLMLLGAFVLLDTLIICSSFDLTLFGNVCHWLIVIFLFFWYMLGNVSIYSIYRPSFNPAASALYCNKALYLFAFCTTTMVNILCVLMVFSVCYCVYTKEPIIEKFMILYVD